MNELVLYNEACRALQAAKSTDEAKDMRDRAEAMRAYAKQAKNKQLEIDAAEIRIRAERRIGELIKSQKETVGLNTGQRGQFTGGSNEAPPAPPTLAEAGIDKKLSSRAQKMAAVPEDEFEGMLGDWRDRIEKENERVTTNLLRAGERKQRDAELITADLPDDKFSVIYADPPWRYEHSKTTSRDIENQYPTMSLDEICDMPVADIAAENSVLFLWTTSPKLAESLRVISSWGFEYRTCAVWDKERMGMGYYFRQQHELLLVATKGSPGTPDPSARVPSVFRMKRGKHSEKPVNVAAAIESMYPDAKRIELFCRNPLPSWSAWGNQANAA